MKIRKFEVTFAIPDDKDPNNIKIDDLVDLFRWNSDELGAEDCAIDVEEILNDEKQG